MPTLKQRVEDFTDAVIVENFIKAITPIGLKCLEKVLCDMDKIAAHLPPGIISTNDLKWDLLELDDRQKLETFLETFGPSFNAYHELPAARRVEIMGQARDKLYGGKR